MSQTLDTGEEIKCFNGTWYYVNEKGNPNAHCVEATLNEKGFPINVRNFNPTKENGADISSATSPNPAS